VQDDPAVLGLNEEITPEDILIASMTRGGTDAGQSGEEAP
jgi:hypothetical protein